MVLYIDKDGALIAAVDGRLFHTGIQRAIKSVLVGIYKSGGYKDVRHATMLWDFVVLKVWRQNSLGKGKATK